MAQASQQLVISERTLIRGIYTPRCLGVSGCLIWPCEPSGDRCDHDRQAVAITARDARVVFARSGPSGRSSLRRQKAGYRRRLSAAGSLPRLASAFSRAAGFQLARFTWLARSSRLARVGQLACLDGYALRAIVKEQRAPWIVPSGLSRSGPC